MSKITDLHPTSGYTRVEEWANSITHGVGIALAIVGLIVAVVAASLAGQPYLIFACAVYGASLILLYTASTLYHSVRSLKWKRRFLVLDHSCIYLLIAGTYTPFALGPLRGPMGWLLFGLIWGLAAIGIVRELMVQKRGGLASSIIFLLMGWIAIAYVVPLYVKLSTPGFVLLFTGGLVYSLGVVFYLWKRMKFHHAIWHLFVIGGAVCQFLAVMTLIP